MNGPEHFEEAERCLLGDSCEYGCPHSGCEHEMRMIARAQAHAMLALAAPQPPAPLYGGCAFCDDDGASDHVRCYCTRDCRKRGCGYRPPPNVGPLARSVCGRCGRAIGQGTSGAWYLIDEIGLDSTCSHAPGSAS